MKKMRVFAAALAFAMVCAACEGGSNGSSAEAMGREEVRLRAEMWEIAQADLDEDEMLERLKKPFKQWETLTARAEALPEKDKGSYAIGRVSATRIGDSYIADESLEELREYYASAAALAAEEKAVATAEAAAERAAEKEAAAVSSGAGDAIAVSAEALTAAYFSNEVRADSQYKNKTVRVTGYATEVRQDSDGDYYVELEGMALSWLSVVAYMKPSEKSKLAGINWGDTVTVVGKCTGLDTVYVYMSGAVLVE